MNPFNIFARRTPRHTELERPHDWPGVPQCPEAAVFHEASLAVRVLETPQAGDMWATVLKVYDFKEAKTLGQQRDVAVQVLKDVADASLLTHPNTVMQDARPQMDTEAFRQYVLDVLVRRLEGKGPMAVE